MLKRRQDMTIQDKRKIFKNQLTEKQLQFHDYIEDTQMDLAQKLFENPFYKEEEEDNKIHLSQNIIGIEEINILSEPELIKEPISDDKSINEKVQKYLDMEELTP